MSEQHPSNDSQGGQSLARKRGSMTVSASPMNSVKLELGIILFVAVIVWLLVEKLTTDLVEQLFWLGLYGVIAMIWLVWRTRRTYRQCLQDRQNETQ